MRMWLVPPEIMCRSHLLGEHHELHMLVGAVNKGISIAGYISAGYADTEKISMRHEELVTEMEKRGYNHHTPIDSSCSTHYEGVRSDIDVEANILELDSRCESCRKLIHKALIQTNPVSRKCSHCGHEQLIYGGVRTHTYTAD